MKKILILIIALSIGLVACNKPSSKAPMMNDKKVQDALIVMVREVKNQDLEKYVRITGKLSGIQDVDLSSDVSGKVVEIYKSLGDWIEAGEAIGRIDNSDYKNQLEQSQASFLSAEAGLEIANLNLQTSEKLYGKEQISKNELLQAKSSQKNAQAGFNGAKATLDMRQRAYDNSQFTSPISGYIAELNLEIGESVSMGRMVAGIVNTKKMILKTGVGETDLKYVQKGDKAIIIKDNKELKGVVTGIGIRPASGSNNYPVEITFGNSDKTLFPGMVVQCDVFAKTFENVIYTSIENLREKYDRKFVYVIDEDNKASQRFVELGEKISNNVIITSGLKKGDKLVIDGIDTLSNGSLVDARELYNNK